MSEVVKVIIHDDNQVLLQLRDDDSSIPYPDHWSLLGGNIEANEQPEQALQRELIEEIGIVVPATKHTVRQRNRTTDHIYIAEEAIEVDAVTLSEGQRIEYIPVHMLDDYTVTPHYKPIIKEALTNTNS